LTTGDLPRFAIVCDAPEEQWPSMDLVAEMLLTHLKCDHASVVDAIGLRPRFITAFEHVPGLPARNRHNLNRVTTRFISYPLQLLLQRRTFDLFHIVDNTYGHLANLLPARRTGVFCHDLDAFSCLLSPVSPKPARWRTAMARAQLRGLQRAAIVFYSTEQVRAQLLGHGLIESDKLICAPYGVSSEFWNLDNVGEDFPTGALPDRPFLLHVGSNMPRKRLDVLFRAFAVVRSRIPELLLVQQGAHLQTSHRQLIDSLGIGNAVLQPPKLSRRALAAFYRKASLVLLTSDKEGFGLPVIEALASGAPVLASDIPAFREVGDDAISYFPVGDVDACADAVLLLLEQSNSLGSQARRQARAARFTWEQHANIVLNAYLQLL
jgi:glycosyltransferase involved in cell wall biosynthesis